MAFKAILGVGLAVGSFLIQSLLPKQKTKNELAEPRADYGDTIRRVMGEHRLATSLTYASSIRERKERVSVG